MISLSYADIVRNMDDEKIARKGRNNCYILEREYGLKTKEEGENREGTAIAASGKDIQTQSEKINGTHWTVVICFHGANDGEEEEEVFTFFFHLSFISGFYWCSFIIQFSIWCRHHCLFRVSQKSKSVLLLRCQPTNRKCNIETRKMHNSNIHFVFSAVFPSLTDTL